MAGGRFEHWVTPKPSLRLRLWQSAYVGYQAMTSKTAKTAVGRLCELAVLPRGTASSPLEPVTRDRRFFSRSTRIGLKAALARHHDESFRIFKADNRNRRKLSFPG
jgi:hypothetical protein